MIDTGAGACIMSRNFATRLGLKTQPAFISGIIPFRLGDDSDQKVASSVKSLQMGNLRLTDASFIVVNDDELFGFAEQPVDGIIGGPILSQFAMFIDFPRRFIAFVTPGNLSDQERANIHLDGVQPIKLGSLQYSGAVARVSTGIDVSTQGSAEPSPNDFGPDRRVETDTFAFDRFTYTAEADVSTGARTSKDTVTIDTGSPMTSISFGAQSKLTPTLSSFEMAATMYNGAGMYGVGTVDSLNLGSLNLSNFEVAYPTSKDTDIPALLGEDVLSYGVALFDFPALKLYIKPTMPPVLHGHISIDPSHVDAQRLQDAAVDIWLCPTASLASATPYDEDDPAAAAAAVKAKIKGDASDADLYMQLGDKYHWDREYVAATAAYAKAAELLKDQPQSAESQAKLAAALSLSGKLDDAERIARQNVASSPADANAWIALGRVLQAKAELTISGRVYSPAVTDGDFSEYVALVNKLIATIPPPDQIQSARQILVEARAAFDKAVVLSPADSTAYRARAHFLSGTAYGIDLPIRQAQGQSADLLQGRVAAPLLADLDQIGVTSNDPEDIRRSIVAEVEEAVQHSNGHVDLREGKLLNSMPQGTRNKIQARMARLTDLSKSTDDVVATKALAETGLLQETILFDKSSAEATLKPLVLAHPDCGEAVQSLAELLSNDNRYDDLVSDLTAAEKMTPTAQIHLTLARTYLRQQKFDDAETEARAALKMKPVSYQTNIVLAAILLHKPQPTSDTFAEAKTCLDAAETAMGGSPSIEYASYYGVERGIYQALTGDPVSASKSFLDVLAKQRNNTQARNALAALLM